MTTHNSPLTPTLSKIRRAETRINTLLTHLREERKNLNFHCICGESHLIKECDLIQTHNYTTPSGCSDGDYWSEGELQVICPLTNVRNRILTRYAATFEESDINRARLQHFSDAYKPCFKSVIDTYRDEPTTPWENNYSIHDRHSYYLPGV